MEDTWFDRDLPVLDAAIRIYDRTGRAMIRAADLERASGLDCQTVQQALRALHAEDYFEKVARAFGGHVLGVATPTGEARRAVEAWPSGEVLTKRLVDALESAADEKARPDEERSNLAQAAAWLEGFGYEVAVEALGGARTPSSSGQRRERKAVGSRWPLGPRRDVVSGPPRGLPRCLFGPGA